MILLPRVGTASATTYHNHGRAVLWSLQTASSRLFVGSHQFSALADKCALKKVM